MTSTRATIAAFCTLVAVALCLFWTERAYRDEEGLEVTSSDTVPAPPPVVEPPTAGETLSAPAEDTEEKMPQPSGPAYRVLGPDGLIIYEGDIPFSEAFPGPPPIEPLGDPLPSVETLAYAVDLWFEENYDAREISVSDLALVSERSQFITADRLMLVDGRMLVRFDKRGPVDDVSFDRLVNLYSELTFAMNRAEKACSLEALEVVMQVPRVAKIDEEIRTIKRMLGADRRGVRVRTAPLSSETIYNIMER